jgi:hypothetical protein
MPRTIPAIVQVLLVLMTAAPAHAQTQVFAGGAVSGDFKRFSGDPTASPLDGAAFGAAAEIGFRAAEHWTIRLVLDWDKTTSTSTPIRVGVLTPLAGAAPITNFQSSVANRLTAVSALVGYDSATHRRTRLGLQGGLSFLHVRRNFDTVGPVPLAALPGFSAPTALVIRPYSLVDNVPAPTVGAEVAVDLIEHLALVPAIRAYAFTLNGGPSAFAIRPGVELRWMF